MRRQRGRIGGLLRVHAPGSKFRERGRHRVSPRGAPSRRQRRAGAAFILCLREDIGVGPSAERCRRVRDYDSGCGRNASRLISRPRPGITVPPVSNAGARTMAMSVSELYTVTLRVRASTTHTARVPASKYSKIFSAAPTRAHYPPAVRLPAPKPWPFVRPGKGKQICRADR